MRFRRCTAAKPHHRRSPLSALGEQHLTSLYGADAVPLLAKLRASIDGLPRKVASEGPEEKAALASYSDYTEQRWRDLQAQPSRFETGILRVVFIQVAGRRARALEIGP